MAGLLTPQIEGTAWNAESQRALWLERRATRQSRLKTKQTERTDPGGEGQRTRIFGSSQRPAGIALDESVLHRKGEDLLSVLRAKRLQAKLMRCGPVRTESIDNWHSVTSAKLSR